LLFKDVNASTSVSAEGSADMQSSEANNITSNAATDIFGGEQYALSENDKNLVILIPNEGHHGQVKMMKQGSLLNHSSLKLQL
jgi:hypothetical protein